jgi:hypothetical protein
MSMAGRKSTLNREVVATAASRHLRVWKKSNKNWRFYYEIAEELQIECFYDGDASRWGSCIYCWCWNKRGKPFKDPSEHLIPLILKGTIPSMYGDHPYNKAFACQGCNQEHVKAQAVRERPMLRAYIEFVWRNCPRMPYNIDRIRELFMENAEFCNGQQKKIAALCKEPYTEDIDAP